MKFRRAGNGSWNEWRFVKLHIVFSTVLLLSLIADNVLGHALVCGVLIGPAFPVQDVMRSPATLLRKFSAVAISAAVQVPGQMQ